MKVRSFHNLLISTVSCLAGATAAEISFNHDVRPILSENCFYCHGQDGNQRKGDLRLDDREAALAKGAFQPGDAAASELVKRLFSSDADEQMPPPDSNRHLSSEQRDILTRWIAEGARYETHWTFVPPVRPPVPEVNRMPGVSQVLDRFIVAGLEGIGLELSPEAPRAALMRRLHMDLTGLPPTPEEVDAFVADPAPDAYERLVDRLMASRHFGERLALPWLDAARYADSNGFQQDGDTHQYLWRDWVVDALNADMPFDQFSIEQLAGDLLPNPTEAQLIATGFNRNHLLNGEGGAIAEEQRHVILFDRVDTTATNWLGLTMACAQCHDHKYDPLTQRDYYSMMALFNNVPETGTPSGGGQYRIADPAISVALGPQKEQLEALARAAAAARQEEQEVVAAEVTRSSLEALEKSLTMAMTAPPAEVLLRPVTAVSTGEVVLAIEAEGRIFADGPRPEKATYTITLAPPEGAMTGLHLRTIPDDRLPSRGAGRSDSGNAVLSKVRLQAGGREVRWREAYASHAQADGRFRAGSVLDDNPETGWAFYPEVTTAHDLFLELDEPLVSTPDTPLVLTLEFQSGDKQHQLGSFQLSATTSPHPATSRQVPADMADLLKKLDRSEEENTRLREYLSKTYPSAKLQLARSNAAAADKAWQDFRANLPRVMVMSDGQPRTTRILNRGEYLNPTEAVTPGVPAFLPPLPEGAPTNRLGFARWLFQPEHPLTARVQVNRLWQYFFGTGLIKTSEDLGVQSEVPVHGGLLDWLAVEFRENGWSQKKIIRLIVTSATYRQSSRLTPASGQLDPENRHISRAARFRLPSMILRDAALASSGLLNATPGGKPVYPYQPPDVWESLAITKERDFTYPASQGVDLYRRSLYTFWRRTVGPVNMFDASPRQACKVRSGTTSTPLHALTTLNDVTWTEAARVLAENVMKSSPDPAAQITRAFRSVLGRVPAEKEAGLLLRAYEKQRTHYAADMTAAGEFISVGNAPRDTSLPAAEHAALSAVCLALFNLDETLTRE